VAVVVGLLISFHHGTAGGATIAAVSVGLFFLALVGVELRRWQQVRTLAV